MYLTDAFGQPITQTVHHDAEYVDVYVPDIGNDGGALDTNHVERQLLHEAYDAEEYVINSDYDPTQEYIPRSQRKEWANSRYAWTADSDRRRNLYGRRPLRCRR